jgi:hypothetical protein
MVESNTRQGFYGRAQAANLSASREVLGTSVSKELHSKCVPGSGAMRETRPLLTEASTLISAAEAERRVIVELRKSSPFGRSNADDAGPFATGSTSLMIGRPIGLRNRQEVVALASGTHEAIRRRRLLPKAVTFYSGPADGPAEMQDRCPLRDDLAGRRRMVPSCASSRI